MATNDAARATYPRLSLMMFLQLSIWGSWAVLIGGHMSNLAFTERPWFGPGVPYRGW